MKEETLKEETLEKIAEELGTEQYFKRYIYWDHSPFIKDTGMFFDVHCTNNSDDLLTDPEYFTDFVTEDFIKEAIRQGQKCLGFVVVNSQTGTEKAYPYYECGV